MDNQHRKIDGYRELIQEEIDLINSIKQQGAVLEAMLDSTEELIGVDKRALSIARTHMQTGLMWWVRAVARPEGF